MPEKQLIRYRSTAHARAVYGESYPQGTVFDVVHSNRGINRVEGLSYNTNLVVYIPQDSLVSWKGLQSCFSKVTAADGLNALLEILQLSLHDRISKSLCQ